MRGALVDTTPADLFVRLAEQSATGTLTLTGGDGDATVTFVHGTVAAAQVSTSSARRRLRLGERLVHAGRLEADDLDRVLADQAAAPTAVALGHLLVERGLVAADPVRVLLQEQALEALARILQLRTGQYVFEVDPAPGTRVRVALPVDRALLEVRRRAREAERVREVVPGPTAVPSPTDRSRGDVRMSPDAVSVHTAVDGRQSAGTIASTLGYAYDEASRILYRLSLQGLVRFADNSTGATATAPATPDPVDPARAPVPDVPDPPAASAMSDVPHTDVPAHDDEPAPWVGWAHGAPDEDDDTPTTPAPSVADPPVADTRTTADPSAQPATPAQTRAVDDDTRRALFSELHAVSRAEPDGHAPAWPERATPEPSPAPPDEDPPVDDGSDEQAPPTEPPPDARELPDLSSDEMSSLLRELHDLSRDDD